MSLFDYYKDALNLIDTGEAGLASLGKVDARYASRDDLWDVNVKDTMNNMSGLPLPMTYERQRVPNTYASDRRPGSRGQRYFSDGLFLAQNEATPEKKAEIQTAYTNQANDAATANLANRVQQQRFEAQPRPAYVQPTATPMKFGTYAPRTNAPSGAGATNPAPTRNDLMAFLAQERAKKEGGQGTGLDDFLDPARTGGGTGSGIAGMVNNLAGGGPAGGGPASAYNRRYNGYAMGGMPQAQGYYLGGTTDGMADNIPARIDNNQEARLSDGEFVVPADVVSHLGNGNSSAGAKNLYGMMDRVRTARTGNKQQGKQIDPNKFIPSR